MTISIGENPQNDPSVNKFLDHKSHEGHRGIILALKTDGTQAIIKSLTHGFEGIVKSGKMYLIEEIHEGQYPQTVKEVKKIPDDKLWRKVN